MGLAPDGSWPFNACNLRLMSLNCSRLSLVVSDSCTATKDAPGRESERMPQESGGGPANGLVLGDRLPDRPRDQLFNLWGVSTWPLTCRHRNSYGNIRVLPLGHGGVAIHTPGKDRHETCPRDLPVLHEKPRRVVDMLYEFRVALFCHGYRYGWTR